MSKCYVKRMDMQVCQGVSTIESEILPPDNMIPFAAMKILSRQCVALLVERY